MAPLQTPMSQFGTLAGGISGPLLSGEVDTDGVGCNSLLMGASDFDAVAALKDLSNSAPTTPSKLLRPRDETKDHNTVPYNHDMEGEKTEQPQQVRKKARTSFFGAVKAKVEGRSKNGKL